MLLSDYDQDPRDGQKVSCAARHPLVYQRPQDVGAEIYWINTNAPLAQSIIEQFGVKSTRFRDYLFHRTVDVIVRHRLRRAARNETVMPVDTVSELVSTITREVYSEAAGTLRRFLFEEEFEEGATNGTADSEVGGHVSGAAFDDASAPPEPEAAPA